ncbi:NAD(P)-dependent alcohol dehydrogenase [Pseudoponticoccus marisrubri]|uniref:Enoyl reductase (ER) domain-containing protein n=1 Tax=Pseudoponticoccus marisrubri TaxID=1685382 RepID=A0A0W7WJ16_9RHOB|nr:NAD(P)-dependent alcohol dehydrogenase [Pseudoponticoccus marisrubri]KUF10624.1 hypothetical protein AVJ23_12185 [Pseudoponticoccus marisrubri]
MQAAIYTAYGAADQVRVTQRPVPAPGAKEVLIRVGAAALTTADWRLRASAFPGMLWLPGRLMTGLFAPKQQVLGNSMAGTVVAVGAAVTRFSVGQRVFGFVGHGAHAEYLAVSEEAALVPTPEALDDAGAAALPFGALSALVFLRDVAQLATGQHVLIVGASGGVGAYATQIARAMGAHVTAVAGPGRDAALRGLGAHRVIDYRQEDPDAARAAYDVVLDTVGATSWRQMRRAIRPGGVYVPLNFTQREIWHALRAKLTGGPRVALAVSGDTAEDLAEITAMVQAGTLRPVIDSRFPLARIAEAHAKVESRHALGTVVIDMADAASPARAA